MSKKYGIFSSDGVLRQRLVSGVHVIPAEAIEIDSAMWLRITQEDDGVWMLGENGEIIKQPLPEVLPDYPVLIAAERYKREGVGVTVEGLQIETTRDSQALIASTGLSAVLDPEYRCNFKTVGGFVEIGSAQIIAIAKAVRAHVQACFDRELTLLRAIEAGEYQAEMLLEGWPDGNSEISQSDQT
ncbi:DUF4376 domain-containing protein [Pseudomonas atacamensis]|uniref:DUF4376 domain-containing protein n=1 Tax=Pseudomonas atacamensis TaxID=2565368 RepID=UPI001FAC4FB5|nr:DUF4376 domain-containing protein [Pseudomonas atacamensis]MCI9874498.1 DUF4376 domain-containing protein [Pseudomonas atacamensis]